LWFSLPSSEVAHSFIYRPEDMAALPPALPDSFLKVQPIYPGHQPYPLAI
jgi:hypothetical protein